MGKLKVRKILHDKRMKGSPYPILFLPHFKRLAPLLNALLDADQSHTVSFSLQPFIS